MTRLIVFSLVLASHAAAAAAQDRMPPLPAAALTPAQLQAIEELRSARGIELRGPWVPLLRSPEVLSRARAMGDYLRFNSALAARLSELAILITAREWTQHYEWQAHHEIALKAGLKPEVAAAIADGRHPEGMAEDEAIVYALCSELIRNKGVSDATYARAVAAFGERGVIDAVSITGYYTLLAMVMNTARTPHAGAAPLRPLP